MFYRAGFLGDILLTNAAVRAVRRRYPQHNLVFQCWPQYVSALVGDPHLNAVVPVTHYDYMAEHVLDFRHEDQKDWDSKYWGQLLYEQARRRGLAGKPDETFRPYVYMTPDDVADKEKDAKVCVIHPWSANGENWRLWSLDKWGELVSRLRGHGITPVQVGMAQDPYIEGAYDLRGRTDSIMGLYGIIAIADLVICIDSAILHIAVADKWVRSIPTDEGKKSSVTLIRGAVPTILINGPMSPKCIVPPDADVSVVSYDYESLCGQPCNHSFSSPELPICKYGNACMRSITVDAVWRAVCQKLLTEGL